MFKHIGLDYSTVRQRDPVTGFKQPSEKTLENLEKRAFLKTFQGNLETLREKL